LSDRVLFFASKALKPAASSIAVLLAERFQELSSIIFYQSGRQPERMLRLRQRDRLTSHPQLRAHRVNHNIIVRMTGLLHISMQDHIRHSGNGHNDFRHLRLPPHSVAPTLAIVRSPTVANRIIPTAITALIPLMLLPRLFWQQQTTRPALLIQRSTHLALAAKTSLIIAGDKGFYPTPLLFLQYSDRDKRNYLHLKSTQL
jgi:hypothetical protein